MDLYQREKESGNRSLDGGTRGLIEKRHSALLSLYAFLNTVGVSLCCNLAATGKERSLLCLVVTLSFMFEGDRGGKDKSVHLGKVFWCSPRVAF